MEAKSQIQKTGEKLLAKIGDLKTAEEYVEALKKEKYAPRTIQFYTWTLAAVVKDSALSAKLKEMSWTLKMQLEETENDQKKTPEQEENWVEWEKMGAVRAALAKGKSKREHWRHLVVCLYTLMPPLRLDWADVVLSQTPTKTNYLNLEGKMLVLNQYKTVKTHGPQTIRLPDELCSVLRASLEKYPRKYVVSALSADEPINSALLSTLVKEAFEEATGRSVTLQLLRRIYASHSLKDAPSIRQMEADAKALGHSVATHHKYRKID